ncbi:MAG: hypothetical protein HY554_19065 [Elusimicrobia bacterium]|nr:hypothetical protein [Elusimicrobiota bacterium]
MVSGTWADHRGQGWPVLPARDAGSLARFWKAILGFQEEPARGERRELFYEDGVSTVNGAAVPKERFRLGLDPAQPARVAEILRLPVSWFEHALGSPYLEFYEKAELRQAFEKKVKDSGGRISLSRADNECDGIGYVIEDPEGNKVELCFTCCGIDKAQDWRWLPAPSHGSDDGYRTRGE